MYGCELWLLSNKSIEELQLRGGGLFDAFCAYLLARIVIFCHCLMNLCHDVCKRSARYPRRARSAIGVDTVFTLDVCLYVSALERKRLIGMT